MEASRGSPGTAKRRPARTLQDLRGNCRRRRGAARHPEHGPDGPAARVAGRNRRKAAQLAADYDALE
ncbi:hypothetical protein ABZS66_55325, partial [Dactylosporangium sp. NPDC005572]|uniref:hypothetical protein n=1 Tax=Dactylosporangium sp. NPDC005572 TaxID=3156889 RepID=UPI0033A01A8B